MEKIIPNRKMSIKKVTKPLIIITWSNAFVWFLSCLILCGCIFTIGVLVGRGTAPIGFDIKKLTKNVPLSYIEEQRRKTPRIDPKQIKPIDVFGELKDRPSKRIHGESDIPSEIMLSESTPIMSKAEPSNDLGLSAFKTQAESTQETPTPESDIEVSDISEEVGKTDLEKVKNIPEDSKAFQPPNVRYVIQVASLNDINNGANIRDKLIQKGYSAFCLSIDISGKIWHRVRIGPYSDITTAKNDCARLKEGKLDALLITVDQHETF